MKIKIYSLITFYALLTGFLQAQNCHLVEGDSFSSSSRLLEVNSFNGNVISTLDTYTSNGEISAIYGIAKDPMTENIYVAYDLGSGVRGFGTIELSTGEVTFISSLSYILQSLAFVADGRLFGLTASNDDTPSNLVQISTEDGSLEFLASYENWGGFSQSLFYDSLNELLFRIEGGGNEDFGNPLFRIHQINTQDFTISNEVIFPSNELNNSPFQIGAYLNDDGTILLAHGNMLYDMTNNGVLTNQREMDVENYVCTGIVKSPSLSIQPLVEKDTVMFYPNPTTNELVLEGWELGTEFKIFNSMGVLVKSGVIDGIYQSIDCSFLSEGYYTLTTIQSSIIFLKQ